MRVELLTLTIAILTIDYPRAKTYTVRGREGIAEVAIENYRDRYARIQSGSRAAPAYRPGQVSPPNSYTSQDRFRVIA